MDKSTKEDLKMFFEMTIFEVSEMGIPFPAIKKGIKVEIKDTNEMVITWGKKTKHVYRVPLMKTDEKSLRTPFRMVATKLTNDILRAGLDS